jgi:hypothetical protein
LQKRRIWKGKNRILRDSKEALLILILVFIQGCEARPEPSLLKSYFHACSLGDVMTMSAIAVDPIKIAGDWKITKVGEEVIASAALPEMARKEVDLLKQTNAQIPVTMNAQKALAQAKDEFNSARTAAARAAAKAKVDDAQKKSDEEYKLYQDKRKAYIDAKTAAAREEEISGFCLNAGQIENIRDLKGNVHSKEIEIRVTANEGKTSKMKITMRMYVLRDEAAGLTRRGQWKIIKFERL